MKQLLLITTLFTCFSYAEPNSINAIKPKNDTLIISGIVNSDNIKHSIADKLQSLYPNTTISNQIKVAAVKSMPEWENKILNSIASPLNKISQGKIYINDYSIKINGHVKNEQDKQEVLNFIANNFGINYKIENNLIIQGTEQNILNDILKGRIIEFKLGSAKLTDSGKKIIDEMIEPILKLKDYKIQIIGHTDNQGSSQRNAFLSAQRAKAVKDYLEHKNVIALIETIGKGDSEPVLSNDTEQGRKQNRRIDFKIINIRD